MIEITKQELEIILNALNIAGGVKEDITEFDNLYDTLVEKANKAGYSDIY